MERIGIILTTIWLCVVAALIYIKWNDAASMSLNEWGDFLSGMVAPLAFLWLIVGYMLQRQELRLNTEVLNLTKDEIQRQAEELAKQTHFQEIQAQAAREQIRAQRSKSMNERRDRLSVKRKEKRKEETTPETEMQD